MKRLALAGTVVVALGAGLWWASDSNPPAPPRSANGQERTHPIGHSAPLASRAGGEAAHHASAADPFLSPDLRFTLEALLLEAGRVESPVALKRRLAQLVPQHFPAAWATRALALAERYVDYRVALAELGAPADARDPRQLRAALDARARLRERHFAAEENAALFGSEEGLHRFTLARLEIERNPQLSTAQKQAALREAENDFPPDQREQRALATVHMTVAAQTAHYDAHGTGDTQRFAERRLLHGEAAAQRLAALDQEEREWQQRLAHYAAAQSQVTGPDELARLRQQWFSPTEQLRLDAALSLRAQGSAPAR